MSDSLYNHIKSVNKYQNRVGEFCKTRRLKNKVLIKVESQINYLYNVKIFVLKI